MVTFVRQTNSIVLINIHLLYNLSLILHNWDDTPEESTYWIIGKHSELTLENKLLLYKTTLRPIWTYGIPLWGMASQSNLEILQSFQNEVLRIANAPWYVPNSVLHTDLSIPTVREEITKLSVARKDKLRRHPKSTTTYPTRGTRTETAQTPQPMWSATQILLKGTSHSVSTSIKWRVLIGTRLFMPSPYSPCLYW
jgi:hypothetical protein